MTTVTTLTGDTVTLDRAIDDLGRAVDGDLLGPHSDTYDEARGLWNGMIERRPGLIVRCVNATTSSRLCGSPRPTSCWSPFAVAATTWRAPPASTVGW